MIESGMTYKEMLIAAEEFAKAVTEFSQKGNILSENDETEKMKSVICDNLCRHSMMQISQEELDNFCSECPLNKVKRIEVGQ